MEVVSVNVGALRPLVVSGREVQTGIFKEPVEGPVAVGSLGLEGDVQADRRVHGGEDQAVYAYAIEDVEWWESELGPRARARASSARTSRCAAWT